MGGNTHLFCNFNLASGSGERDQCNAPAVVRYRSRTGPSEPWAGRCADHANRLNPNTRIVEPYAGTRYIPAGDIEQLVADTENKWDEDRDGLSAEDALLDLLSRLRIFAGIPIDEPQHPMTIGRTDRCLIETPHDASLCGKREAHR